MRHAWIWPLCFGALWLAWGGPAPALEQAEWPQWRGPERDGKSPDTGLLKEWPEGGPKLLWKADGIGKGYATVSVAEGLVYTTGDVGDESVISAFDMEGKLKWRKPHDRAWMGDKDGKFPGSRSTPTIEGGKLYVLSAHGLLGCYTAKTGAKKWTLDLCKTFNTKPSGYGYTESVLIYKKLLVVTPGGKDCIVALDKATGKTVWTSKGLTDGAGFASCVPFTFKNVPLILQVTSKGMVCISAKDGQFLWRNDRVKGEALTICATPVYSDGYCFAAAGYNNGGACVKLAVSHGKLTAEQAWETKDMVCFNGGFVVVDGYIYGNHADGWSCLDLKTGEKKWYVDGVGKGSLIYADGMLYTFAEKKGRMGLLPATPKKPELKGDFKVEGEAESWAAPVLIGGRLYLRYGDNLYVYDVKAPG